MALKTVDIYWLGYSRTKKKLYCYFLLHGEGALRQLYPTPEEFTRLAKQLEGEGPVAFDTVGRYFVSASESAREMEPHHQIASPTRRVR